MPRVGIGERLRARRDRGINAPQWPKGPVTITSPPRVARRRAVPVPVLAALNTKRSRPITGSSRATKRRVGRSRGSRGARRPRAAVTHEQRPPWSVRRRARTQGPARLARRRSARRRAHVSSTYPQSPRHRTAGRRARLRATIAPPVRRRPLPPAFGVAASRSQILLIRASS